ncbi:MAG TPA: PQQ-binding-like beta-propeller repeat protein [Armatimonadota bacterium]|nr:PQQ-binding-like beta-propeller repeat protein [Armatimonadota bacterium]
MKLSLWLVPAAALTAILVIPRLHMPRSGLARPPFVRRWTVLSSDVPHIVAVRNGSVYYYGPEGLGAIDLASGQQRWLLPTVRPVAAVLHGQTVYATVSAQSGAGFLEAVDLASRRMRVLASIPVKAEHLAVSGGQVYTLDDGETLRAYNERSGSLKWARPLAPGHHDPLGMSQLVATTRDLYVAVDNARDAAVGMEAGIEPVRGRVLWSRRKRYPTIYPACAIGADVITQGEDVERINLHTGRVVWTAVESMGDGVAVKNRFIYTANALPRKPGAASARGAPGLVGVSIADGHICWAIPFSFGACSVEWDQAALYRISDADRTWMAQDSVVGVSRTGALLWHAKDAFTGTPAYADSTWLVTTDIAQILGYRMGRLAPLPADASARRRLAASLAAQFEKLDTAERRQLQRLTPYSFRPLLARYVEWAERSDKKVDTGLATYNLLIDSQPLLTATCQKQDTAVLVAACRRLGPHSEWKGPLEKILQEKGDQTGYIPELVRQLRALPLKDRTESAALSAVSHSSHPAAVALMLEALRDPSASPDWRAAAFCHLAGTGGPAGVEAVKQARSRSQRLKPWYDRIDLDHLSSWQKLSARTDARGRTWILFHSPILGNASDLFIVEKRANGWGRPLFTGAWTGWPWYKNAPRRFRGIPMPRLVAGEWIKLFPDDASLRRDSDGDGLTDLVEARLGTDPHRADTDGDGIPDAVDPCPNAAPRPLQDDEKVIAACIDARFFSQDWGVPAVLSVKTVKPFELYGYSSPVLWQQTGKPGPLDRFYGGGVNMLSFEYPSTKAPTNGSVIEYGADRTTAWTIISRYSGGRDGDGIEATLKKIGDDWFVTDLQERYIS